MEKYGNLLVQELERESGVVTGKCTLHLELINVIRYLESTLILF